MDPKRLASRVGGDAREWDEEGYRRSVLLERELSSRIVFRTAFAPSRNPNPESIVVASSDGSISLFSISTCVNSFTRPMLQNRETDEKLALEILLADPHCTIKAHKGPAYDLTFYGNDEEALLLSCGDDGCIRGWKWSELPKAGIAISNPGEKLNPVIEFINPQHEGPWGAISPVPENNAIAVNGEEGSVFSAAGDSCAYSWDMETAKKKVVFKGHSDYLHSVVVRKSSSQIITGSEDGTVRLWDCRSGRCAQVLYPGKIGKLKESTWVSSVSVDASENWLVCGTGRGLSVWSLLSYQCIFSTDSCTSTQDLCFHENQILAVGSEPILRSFNINGRLLSQVQCAPCSAFSVSAHLSGMTAVGGYGGLVDLISEFGSHLCIFCCKGADEL
ncbi:WD repeat-containing protein DWA1 [Apostasia shenzhenica]|uniref:WD repeat-containing protein DWA1 n=1 Tax=Apostasia shenzhenica TaxID=1088818 RepID=A0A2I0ANW7_9ASPA|nr:WD repeat-containing protein DWA1 [Apostasia shenzhenica]